MMIRNKTSTTMQKCYDECYLICSTAVYFEGQNNESEALRSWRSALDRIYYHNAYRMPPDWKPKTETEKALQDSLHHMEMQCKERVSLLEALRDSRAEAEKESKERDSSSESKSEFKKPLPPGSANDQPGWLGQGTVPPTNYPDIPRPQPLPQRPAARPLPTESRSYRMDEGSRPENKPTTIPVDHKPLTPNPPPVLKQTSRTPSPDKKDTRNKLKTTLRSTGNGKRSSSSNAKTVGRKPPAASKAAGLAWDSTTKQVVQLPLTGSSTPTAASGFDAPRRESYGERPDARQASSDFPRQSSSSKPPTPPPHGSSYGQTKPSYTEPLANLHRMNRANNSGSTSTDDIKQSPTPPAAPPASAYAATAMRNQAAYTKPDFPTYRSEYAPTPVSQASIAAAVNRPRAQDELPTRSRGPPGPPPQRRPAANASAGRRARPSRPTKPGRGSSESADETTSSVDPAGDGSGRGKAVRRKRQQPTKTDDSEITPDSSDDEPEGDITSADWEERLQYVRKNLPKGVDPVAAKQIFNEIVVQGDEVHWEDIAGLDAAKKALKEAVVYPFLRPDLFMGLREPARGMLLFGPPGTGKTMLARAVATESRSTFFSISASSLTSKWLGDSEKLVRALFNLAKALAPSIIFVDEIDSLLSSRGGSSEHETTRRIKTEFLVQWSDLQRAAAGREPQSGGDATRVLVLAATNLPWAIDDAARRRFVRRQYIPLPEKEVRAEQLRTLLSHQKHGLNRKDIEVLVRITDGYSGSDITALAKDAAMGPLRSLGEALLHMASDEIRPIEFQDFESSLINIRPSVSKDGLKEFEDWARQYGERGG